MPNEILLLTDPAMAQLLEAGLRESAPDIEITVLTTKDEVAARFAKPLNGVRLIAAGTDVILSADQLAALDGPAYNLHPGSPEYPGLFPSVFALYQGAEQFGTTVHEMTADVDGGPIVAVERFDIPKDADRLTLDQLSLASLIGLFNALAGHFAFYDTPLPPVGENWGAKRWTRKDFNDLCRLPEGIDKAEFERRYRAIGEGPDHALETTLFGHRFVLDNRRKEQPVYVAGLSADRDSSA